ncbi:hypothetical protein BDZ94DRAFT_1171866 [Collybia nuda]|uniref:Uncharacterized protein n=1 Tax=Collybia nuda TaxID=64659 RepID=A0A9P5XZ39_9AGAR|nr:hypothetical protein BDZ94DRAFT_1171866 [Collybia nuda]
MASTPVHTTDTQYLVRDAMTTGYQLSSFLVPPLYTAFIVFKRGRPSFSLNRLLRATWMGGLVGTVGSGGLSYALYAHSTKESLRARKNQAAYNINRIKADDHALIGTVLMSVLTPAVLWNRAHIINLVLGGAGFGSNIGLLIFYGTNDPVSKPKTPIYSVEQ